MCVYVCVCVCTILCYLQRRPCDLSTPDSERFVLVLYQVLLNDMASPTGNYPGALCVSTWGYKSYTGRKAINN